MIQLQLQTKARKQSLDVSVHAGEDGCQGESCKSQRRAFHEAVARRRHCRGHQPVARSQHKSACDCLLCEDRTNEYVPEPTSLDMIQRRRLLCPHFVRRCRRSRQSVHEMKDETEKEW